VVLCRVSFMMSSNLVLGSTALIFAGVACGGTIAENGSGGGTTTTTGIGAGTTTASSATTTTGIGGSSSSVAPPGVGGSSSSVTSSATTGAGGGSPACQPSAACEAVGDVCLGLVDNSGQTTFGLRMSELDLTAPAALATGIVKATFAGDVTPALPACNLLGTGTFSWLLQFDTVAGTLTTGGARPVADPAQGYAFDDEMITQGAVTFHVQPVKYMAVFDATGTKFSIGTGQDLIMPIFLDATGAEVVLLPLRAARFTMGALSASQDCIGSYNAASLQPANSCQPDGSVTQFTDGASLDGFITLQDADSVIISVLDESLCALLAGGSPMYTMPGAGGVTVCTRDANGNVLFQGNWCDATNEPATSTCADAVAVAGNFAASSVLITN
jgi:hypothetical protein